MKKPEKRMKIRSIDNGFCRVNYIALNDEGQKGYFCIQDEGQGIFITYRCSYDNEPMYEVYGRKSAFEVPRGDTRIERDVRKYLQLGDI